MRRPPINNAPPHLSLLRPLPLQLPPPLPQLVQTTPRGGAAILRILRKRHGPPAPAGAKPVAQHLRIRVLCQRVRVAERDVRFMRGRVRGCFVEDGAGGGGLVFGPATDRGAAADGGVLGLDFWGAAGRDEAAEVGLVAAEGDEVAVGEEAGEEGGDVRGCLRAAHVEEDEGCAGVGGCCEGAAGGEGEAEGYSGRHGDGFLVGGDG